MSILINPRKIELAHIAHLALFSAGRVGGTLLMKINSSFITMSIDHQAMAIVCCTA